MGITIRVKDEDKKYEAFRAAVAELEDAPSLSVGVHEDVGAQPHAGRVDATIAQVALAQEYRRGGSWLRATVDELGPRIPARINEASQRALHSAIAGSRSDGAVERELSTIVRELAGTMRARLRRNGQVETGALARAVEGRINGRNPEVR